MSVICGEIFREFLPRCKGIQYNKLSEQHNKKIIINFIVNKANRYSTVHICKRGTLKISGFCCMSEQTKFQEWYSSPKFPAESLLIVQNCCQNLHCPQQAVLPVAEDMGEISVPLGCAWENSMRFTFSYFNSCVSCLCVAVTDGIHCPLS